MLALLLVPAQVICPSSLCQSWYSCVFAVPCCVQSLAAVRISRSTVGSDSASARASAGVSAASTVGRVGSQSRGVPETAWPATRHGTVHYAAPEDLCSNNGVAVTCSADVFSLGICMWEALSG